MTMIVIFLLYYVYKYLNELENVECAIRYRKDIETLKIQEMFLIILNVFTLLVSIFDIKITEKLSLWVMILLFMFNMIFLLVFIINVYKLYNKMPKNCDKFNKYPRYILYVQSLVYLIAVLLMSKIMLLNFILYKR